MVLFDLEQTDREVYDLIRREEQRQQHSLNLIASENHASRAVLQAISSVMTDKYAEGYPGRRYYAGCLVVDEVEQLCIDRAKALFGAEHANVQPHSGTGANLSVYMACLKPGDRILAMDLSCGGHLSHGLSINMSGQTYLSFHYGVRRDTERIDMDEVLQQAKKVQPKLIVAGASAYPRIIDFAAFADVAKRCGAFFMADIAHIAGLVMAQVHPSPVPCADFVTTTTHKTHRGPRGGMILCKERWAKPVDQAVFPGMQGGPQMHVIAAKAVALKECARPDFRLYAAQILANAKALAAAMQARGWRLVSGGTENHLMLIDLNSRDELDGERAQKWLSAANIICNKNKIPFDTRPSTHPSGIRLGTPALTTRGMKEPQMQQLAGWIDEILISHGNEKTIQRIRNDVQHLCDQYPIPAVR
jgi:glycine hydroxymethyltransferase